MKFNLRAKMAGTILGAVLVLGALATWATFTYAKDVIFDLQKDNLRKITIEQTHETRQLFDNIMQLVATLTTQSELIEYLEDQDKLEQESHILRHLNLYNINGSFSAIYMMDKTGYVWSSTEASFVGNNYSFREYFKEAVKDRPFVDVSLGVTSEKLGYYFSWPIRNEKEILGVAVIKVMPEVIHDSLDVTSYSPGSHIMMTDQYGVVVFSSEIEQTYKSIGPLSDDEKLEIKEKRRFGDLDIEPLQYEIAKSALDNFESAVVLSFHDHEDEEVELLSISRIGDLPFFVIIEEDAEPYLQPAKNIAYIISLMVVMAAFISSLFIFIFISKFLKPLEPLEEAAEQISKGNYDYYLEVKNNDELGDLAKSFNSMTRKIKQSRINIEKKVVERTAQLEKLNKHLTGREIKMLSLKKKIIDLETKQKNK